jgi:sugar lactone lactonase YvrE
VKKEKVARLGISGWGAFSVVIADAVQRNAKAKLVTCFDDEDEGTLYVAEGDAGPNGPRELRAYPIRNDGSVGPYTVLHTFGADHRGLDSEGNIVACAGWRRSGPGPLIYVFSPSGAVLETHPVPADLPMRCAFGDADLESLYVTTGEGHLYRAKATGRRGVYREPSPHGFVSDPKR